MTFKSVETLRIKNWMSTDHIADMLTKVRNAYLAKHRVVRIPSTKMTRSIARILLSEKFINSFRVLRINEVLEFCFQKSLLVHFECFVDSKH